MTACEIQTYDPIFSMIEAQTGIRVNESHRLHVERFIEARLAALAVDEDGYLARLSADVAERQMLFDETAINETYFFRECQQFEFLRGQVFPQFCGKSLAMWSAACSTGEEALSLYALAKSCGIAAEVYATDIDGAALELFRAGNYGPHSFKQNETDFWPLLDAIGERGNNTLRVNAETKRHIHISWHNLLDAELPMPPKSLDVIFLRNVFIYFSAATQLAVLKKLCDALKVGGLLLLSINEIASIECPESLMFVKEHCGSVYYLRKVTPEEKAAAKGRRRQPPAFSETAAPRYTDRTASAQPLSAARCAAAALLPLEEPAAQNKPRFAPVFPSPAAPQTQAARTSAAQEGAATSLEDLWRTVTDLTNKGETDAAEKLVQQFAFKSTQLEYKYYLLGTIAQRAGSITAEDGFFRASVVNPKFWPAFFQLALVYRADSEARSGFAADIPRKRAIEAFRRCKAMLETKGAETYPMITESFSPSYFSDMCARYIASLEAAENAKNP